jgi:hypothetical protein
MSPVAASNFGISASVMRPISPYLKAPALAHSTTSRIAWLFLIATRRAVVRNSLRSRLKPERPCDPFPLSRAGCETAPLAGDLPDPFPPFEAELPGGDNGSGGGFGPALGSGLTGAERASVDSDLEEPFVG